MDIHHPSPPLDDNFPLDVDNDNDDRKHGDNGGDNIRKPTAHIKHGDPFVVSHHAITAPSVSPAKRSVPLDDDDRRDGFRLKREGRETESNTEVFCQR